MPSVEQLGGGWTLRQDDGFRLTQDTVLLADFARPPARGRVCDLGCGGGALGLLLCRGRPALRVDGVEIQPAAVRLARENIARNGLEGRMTAVLGDWRACRPPCPPGGMTWWCAIRPISRRARAGSAAPRPIAPPGTPERTPWRMSAAPRRGCSNLAAPGPGPPAGAAVPPPGRHGGAGDGAQAPAHRPPARHGPGRGRTGGGEEGGQARPCPAAAAAAAGRGGRPHRRYRRIYRMDEEV